MARTAHRTTQLLNGAVSRTSVGAAPRSVLPRLFSARRPARPHLGSAGSEAVVARSQPPLAPQYPLAWSVSRHRLLKSCPRAVYSTYFGCRGQGLPRGDHSATLARALRRTAPLAGANFFGLLTNVGNPCIFQVSTDRTPAEQAGVEQARGCAPSALTVLAHANSARARWHHFGTRRCEKPDTPPKVKCRRRSVGLVGGHRQRVVKL